MAASVPSYPMPQEPGEPGKPGDPGYQGSLGATVGGSIGFAVSGGNPVVAAICTAIGADTDFLFGRTGSSAPKPPKPPPYIPPYRTMDRYQAIATNLQDPGASAPPGIEPNIQLARGAAASNLKKKLFG